jgi:hypothetical protein
MSEETKVFKEWMPTMSGGKRYSLRTTTYAHSLLFFFELFCIACQNFPDLKAADVEITRQAGPRRDRQMAIEWVVESKKPAPAGYTEVVLNHLA